MAAPCGHLDLWEGPGGRTTGKARGPGSGPWLDTRSGSGGLPCGESVTTRATCATPSHHPPVLCRREATNAKPPSWLGRKRESPRYPRDRARWKARRWCRMAHRARQKTSTPQPRSTQLDENIAPPPRTRGDACVGAAARAPLRARQSQRAFWEGVPSFFAISQNEAAAPPPCRPFPPARRRHRDEDGQAQGEARASQNRRG